VTRVLAAAAALLLASGSPLPGHIEVQSITPRAMVASLTFFSPRQLPGESAVRGRLFLDEDPIGIPVAGRLTSRGHVSTARLRMAFSDVREEVFERLAPSGISYVLRGRAGDATFAVSGAQAWNGLAIAPEARRSMAGFARLAGVSLRSLSVSASRARAELSVRNPFGFDVKIASIRYRLEAGGREIGRGSADRLLVHRGGSSRLDLPISVDHAALAGAAGAAVLSGGEMEGELAGEAILRAGGGDVTFPFRLPGRIEIF
jgi:hypothetical protein